MTQNNTLQTFKGGWNQLEHAKFTDNKTTIPDGDLIVLSEYISPDGTKLFVTTFNETDVRRYTLSTPWDVSTRGDVDDTFVFSFQFATSSFFKPEGDKMFVIDFVSKLLLEYNVPIPFTPSSIVDAPVSISISAVTAPFACTFSQNGDFVFFVDGNVNKVHRFPLPTPWDITSNTTNDSSVFSHQTDSISFKPEGDKMYLGDVALTKIIEYDLSTNWDISSSVLVNTLSPDDGPFALFFRTNGSELLILNGDNDSIIKYHLDESWNILTASSFSNESLDTGTFLEAISWKRDGTKFFILDSNVTNIQEFSASAPWNITNPVSGGTFDVSTAEPVPLGMWWRPDGIRCYIVGGVNRSVVQLNASTPWDVSTITDPAISFVLTQDENPIGIYFRSDGLKFYVVNIKLVNNIFEYNMTVPWDITTAVFSGNSIVLSAFADMADLFFSNDGKNLYTVNPTTNLVVRYVLSVPWDITTAIFVDSFDVSAQETGIQGLFIRQDDGKKLFITGFGGKVFSYDMSLEFNNTIISTQGEELITNAGEILVYA